MKNADTLRLYGELLQANQWAIQKGDRQATVQNYYTGEDVTIRLDPALDPTRTRRNTSAIIKEADRRPDAEKSCCSRARMRSNTLPMFCMRWRLPPASRP